jgi:SAM-dependent methyltransferase
MFNHPIVNQCLTFINDVPRNTWYKNHLRKLCADKTIFEVGCGAGLLAAYTLQYGAKHYYGVDIRSDRAKFTSEVLDRLGYHNQHTVWCADAGVIMPDDLPDHVDIVLCEQTSHQMQNNFNIQKFWKNLHKKFPNAIFLPDVWFLDAYIYEGLLDSTLSEYQPHVILEDSSLPKDYVQVLSSMDFVRPSETLRQILKITAGAVESPLEFMLDLTSYKSATIVLFDHIGYQDTVCLSQSSLTDWPIPVKITISEAGCCFRFYWNTLERKNKFPNGFWSWEKI